MDMPPSSGQGRTVSAPIEHQGLRNALRGAYPTIGDATIPEDMRQLLAKLH